MSEKRKCNECGSENVVSLQYVRVCLDCRNYWKYSTLADFKGKEHVLTEQAFKELVHVIKLQYYEIIEEIEERIKQDKQRIKQYKEAIDKMIHALFELERRLKP